MSRKSAHKSNPEVAAIDAVLARKGTIYRDHHDGCPEKPKGAASYEYCKCWIYIYCRQNGKDLQQSLFTRDWEVATKYLKEVEAGTSIEDVTGRAWGSPIIRRRHKKKCPDAAESSHSLCRCPIYIYGAKSADGERIGKGRWLRTNKWDLAVQRLALIKGGTPVDEAIRRMLWLFRVHKRGCPGEKLGHSYEDCRCPIHVDGLKRENVLSAAGGKRIQHRSLNTNIWDIADERRALIENGMPVEVAAHRFNPYRHHHEGCPEKPKGVASYEHCKCAVYMDCGYKDGKRIKRSLKTSDWDEALVLLAAAQKAAETPPMSVGARLRAARKKAGLSQAKAVKGIERQGLIISIDSVRNHESDENVPREAVQRAYAALYKKTEAELFG